MIRLLLWHHTLRLALACLDGWDRAPIVPRLEPEVRVVVGRKARETADADPS